jgi:hypothetical protein
MPYKRIKEVLGTTKHLLSFDLTQTAQKMGGIRKGDTQTDK